MRLCTFTIDGGRERVGALVGETVIELASDHSAADAPTLGMPAVLDALAEGGAPRARIEALIAEQKITLKIAAVRFRPPVMRPGKIVCIGQNYRAHVLEMKRELPKHPVLFAKFANTLVGHNEPIRLPRVSTQVDYEAELMIVIGRRGKDITPESALDYVAGYTIFNDVSVRDYQRRTSQFLQGKTFDTTGPCGAAIVTADEVGDPHNLRIQLRLNGETMQDGTTADFIFDVPTIVSYLSEIMTLETGDLIATGTPEGVGFARDPQVFLKAGDVVEIEIDGLGVLRNPVVGAAEDEAA